MPWPGPLARGSLISGDGDDYSSLVVLPLDGGAIRSLATVTSFIDVPFAVSSTAVYALGFNATEDAGLSHVVRTPLDGGPAQSLAVVPTDDPSGATSHDIALASDGTIYVEHVRPHPLHESGVMRSAGDPCEVALGSTIGHRAT